MCFHHFPPYQFTSFTFDFTSCVGHRSIKSLSIPSQIVAVAVWIGKHWQMDALRSLILLPSLLEVVQECLLMTENIYDHSAFNTQNLTLQLLSLSLQSEVRVCSRVAHLVGKCITLLGKKLVHLNGPIFIHPFIYLFIQPFIFKFILHYSIKSLLSFD